ncbi:MAG: hypothetical protein ACRDFW_14620 [bacterium]
MRRLATFVAGVLAGVLVWGVAWATIPDSGGVIHGCYADQRGNLRVIDTEVGQTCGYNETGLVWNQTGPQGTTGPQGPPGPAAPEWPRWYTTTILVDGAAFRSSVDGVTGRKTGVGFYFVTFPRPLRSCEYFTTPTEGPIFAVPYAAYRYAGPENEVMVQTYDADGLRADAAFELGIICYAGF